MMPVRFVAFACCGMLFGVAVVSSMVRAEEFRLSPDSDLKNLLSKVTAGDSVVLTNGTWKDAELTFDRFAGTDTAPIQIRAETAGKVIFTGATEFRFSGTHVVVSGFEFRDTDGVADVVQLRTHSERHADHCRMTDCVFEQTSESKTGSESRWLSVYGTNNRIDHCYFAGKRNRGSSLVVWVSDQLEQHRIDHNHFGPRPELGRNGGETIRIGTSEVSELRCQTIVEDNYFHRCDGEAETVSNKSCENVYRHNVFDECSGTLTLRHGHRCRVDGNVFLGRQVGGTGGVRIIGQQHRVTNNYFEGLRGDAERAAICLMNGIPGGSLNSYAPVRDAVIAHNTLIDCKVSMEFGVGAGKKQSAAATDCRISHNVFMPGKWTLFRVHDEPVNASWQGNKQSRGSLQKDSQVEIESVDLRLARAEDGLLRPTEVTALQTPFESDIQQDVDGDERGKIAIAGCDEPSASQYQWPSAENTGPTWNYQSGL